MRQIAALALLLTLTNVFATNNKPTACSNFSKAHNYMEAVLDNFPGETLFFAIEMNSNCEMGNKIYKYWRAHPGYEGKLGYKCSALHPVLAHIFKEDDINSLSSFEKRIEMDVLETVTKNTDKSFGTHIVLKSSQNKNGQCEIKTEVEIEHKSYVLKQIHVIKGGISLTFNPRLRSAIITVKDGGQTKKIKILKD